MALEQFKTQVLILHSQQSTLDSLVRGFSDRYAVHGATSGAEALNTLGTTQIDVLVSAQNLPGMSGIDALREAKKRSPLTIGILLAGTDAGDELEALVNDKVVYEVVRGEVTPQRLCKLVDDATRQVRLLALAESANDTTASPDEPAGEHIVMETAENGSVIISDGTGTLPALNPEKLQISPNARGAEVDVLVLTRDEDFLATVKESARGLHKVHHASTHTQAGDIARNEGVGVLVTDAAMIGSNIEELTDQLRAHVPRLVAIVAGRRDDGDLLMDLINRGHVYRFLLKPVSPGRGRLAIEASVKHHLDAPDASFKGKPRTAMSPAVKPAPVPAAIPPEVPTVAQKPATPARSVPASARPEPPLRQSPPVANAATSQRASEPVDKPVLKPVARPVPAQPVAKSAAAPPAPQAVARSAAAPPARQPVARSATAPPAPQPVASPPVPPAPKPVARPTVEPPTPVRPVTGQRRGPAPMATPLKPRPAPSPTRKEPRISASTDVPSLAAAGLDQAFDDGGSYTKTVDRVAASIGKSMATVAGGVRAVAHAAAIATTGIAAALRNPRVLAMAGIVAVLALAGVWLFGGDDAPQPRRANESPRTTMPAPAERDLPIPAAITGSPAEQPLTAPLFEDLLGRAREARDQGDIYAPAGRNAMEFYIAARAAVPANAEVSSELAALTEVVFSLAETALLENRYADASRALRVISLADPDNPRLNFMNAQLAQLELRGRLDEARAAIRDFRFEDAGRILAQAETLAGDDTREIELLSGELAAARSAQRLDEVLSLASRAANQGRLTSPSNDNARYYFELALTLDRGNTAAQQGLTAIAGKLVLNARNAIDTADFVAADRLLAEARALDPASEELAKAAASLAAARRETELRKAEQTKATASSPAAEPGGVAAAVLPETGSVTIPAKYAAGAADDSAITPEPPAETPATSAQPANLAPPNQTPVIAINTLKRTDYVPPKYPRSAQRRNIEGWVDLVFTVTPGGKVANIEVIDADPATTFNDSAVEAVEQWQFEPVIENGVPVSKRVAVRMSFTLQ